MIKPPFGQKLCKITSLPYQSFRWKAGPNGRHKETVVSFVVARERNICQCCLNDMRFGLPVGVRDQLLKDPSNEMSPALNVSSSHSIVSTQYQYLQLQQQQQQQADEPSKPMSQMLADIVPTRQLDYFARTKSMNPPLPSGPPPNVGHGVNHHMQTAFRNLPKLCSFWLAGTCTRVLRKTCPYRPCCGSFAFPEIAGSNADLCKALIEDLNKEGPAAIQKKISKELRDAFQQSQRGNRDDAIRKRVAGKDDLTRKYLNQMKTMDLELQPPSDESIVTLWLGNVDPNVLLESDIRAVIYPYGTISSIYISRAGKCAFVEYADRASAEYAASQLYNALIVKGVNLTVNWAKPRNSEAADSSSRAVYGAGTSAHASSSNGGVGAGGVQYLPAPPGLESAPMSRYALPNMPRPAIYPTADTVEVSEPTAPASEQTEAKASKKARLDH